MKCNPWVWVVYDFWYGMQGVFRTKALAKAFVKTQKRKAGSFYIRKKFVVQE